MRDKCLTQLSERGCALVISEPSQMFYFLGGVERGVLLLTLCVQQANVIRLSKVNEAVIS